MTTTIPPENSYLALLSFAEGFRTTTPPDLKSCLQCLLAAVSLPIDVRSLLKTHLQIIKLVLNNTDNILVAQSHCEKAVKKIIYLFKKKIVFKILDFITLIDLLFHTIHLTVAAFAKHNRPR